MPYNITIDHATTAHNSDESSGSSDEEDSSGTGVQVSPRSVPDSHDYSDQVEEQDGGWILPSDSASRPRTSNQQRPIIPAPQPENARHSSYRRHTPDERVFPPPRAHRSPPSEPTESVDSHEDWQGYARGPPQQYHNRQYAAPYAPQGYPPPHPYQTYPPQSVVPGGQQQIVPFGYQPYPPPAPGPASPYFPHGHHVNHGHHPGMGHEMIPHGPVPGQYFPYAPSGFPMPMPPPAVYQVYSTPPPAAPAAAPAPAPTPTPAAAKTPPPPPPPPDTSKYDENLARLEKLLLDQKAEQETKEAILLQAAKDAAAKAEADKAKADEIAKASAAAAAAAKVEVENQYKAAAAKAAADAEAEAKKAEEIATASAAAAAAAKAEVEKEYKAAADAAKDAAAVEKPAPPPKEPDKPIKFKDAIGRRFSFPFDLCREWRGMEYLIKEAFLHVEEYGPHVANGEYDLVGPHDEIIMKAVWEIVVKPGWEISMHMWPIPEPPPIEALPEGITMVDEGVPPPPPPAPSAPGSRTVNGKPKKAAKPPPFMSFWSGKPKKKPVKAKKR